MGVGRGNFMAVLAELGEGEQDLADAYSRAYFLFTNGALTEDLRARYQVAKGQVHANETALHGILQRVLPDALMAHIPAPTALPDLPPLGDMPTFGGAAGTTPVGAAGLGNPALLWAVLVGGVILRIVQILAIVYAINAGLDLARAVFTMRENTKRYKLLIQAQQQRFLECIRRTGDIAQCAAVFPTPEPAYERLPESRMDPLLLATGILASAGALAGLGYVGYRVWRSNAARPRTYRARGARGRRRSLSQREIRRRLTRRA